MLDWLKGWTRATWAMAVGLALLVLVVLVLLLGADWARGAIAAVLAPLGGLAPPRTWPGPASRR